MSHQSQNKVINMISCNVLRKLWNNVGKTKTFAIVVDGTKDMVLPAKSKNLCVFGM